MAAKARQKIDRSVHLALLIAFLLFLGLMTYIVIYLLNDSYKPYGLSYYLPGSNTTDIIFLMTVPVALSIIFLFIAMFLTSISIKFARFIKFNKYEVTVQKINKKYTWQEIMQESFYASLFAVALSLLLNNFLYELGIEFIQNAERSYSAAALTMMFTPFSVLFMYPAWFMEDSGIIFFKRSNLIETEANEILTSTYDITSIGTFYGYLLRGFAGLTTPILYVYGFIADNVLNKFSVFSIALLFLPFLLTGVYSITQWIYLAIMPSIKKFLLRRKKHRTLVLEMKFELPEGVSPAEYFHQDNEL